MKTSVSLTILGVYNALMGVMCLLMPRDMGAAAIGEANAANPELLEMATMFHYGIGHAISMCGLILLVRSARARWTPRRTPCSLIASAQPCS